MASRYDEAFDVIESSGGSQFSESESPGSPSSNSPGPQTKSEGVDSTPNVGILDHVSEEDSASEGESSGTPSSSESSSPSVSRVPNAYNPSEYANLKVSQEVKDLFQYIERFKPRNIELETRLKPFIPEYSPSVGEIDAFLKIPRPDGKNDNLGLTRLDEPAASQSDKSVVTLQLKSMVKKVQKPSLGKYAEDDFVEVRKLEDAEKHSEEVNDWIEKIRKLHQELPPPVTRYSRKMPEMDDLMQVWPVEFEAQLNSVSMPKLSSLDLSLQEQISIIAALLDIPVYNHLTETVHLLFSLFCEARANQHFALREREAALKQ